jgi:acyl-CoA hydrolase
MSSPPALETLTHRLILPRDANHHGTLYAGAMLALALEAGYAAAYRSVGRSANLVLKRVLDLRCFEPVSIGSVVEIRGLEVFRARAHVVVGLTGTPLPNRPKPWMDALMQFVQVDESGSPEPLAGGLASAEPAELPAGWESLRDRAVKLLAIRP